MYVKWKSISANTVTYLSIRQNVAKLLCWLGSSLLGGIVPVQSEIRLAQLIISLKISLHLPAWLYLWEDILGHGGSWATHRQPNWHVWVRKCAHLCVRFFTHISVCFCTHYKTKEELRGWNLCGCLCSWICVCGWGWGKASLWETGRWGWKWVGCELMLISSHCSYSWSRRRARNWKPSTRPARAQSLAKWGRGSLSCKCCH